MYYMFHSHANPAGFVARGSESESQSYLARLNRGRVLDLWAVRPLTGAKPRGPASLADLLADHDAAHRENVKSNAVLLAHGHKGVTA